MQKHIDEILARETSLDDVDTKPGMMRILAKRVNEVEKEIAKETRKKTDEREFNPNDERDEAPREGDVVNHKDLGKVSVVKVTGSDKMGQPAEYIVQTKLSYDELMGDVELGKFENTNESGILYRAGVKKYGKAGMKAIQLSLIHI